MGGHTRRFHIAMAGFEISMANLGGVGIELQVLLDLVSF